MTQEIWLSLLRKALTLLGAYLASKGLPGIDDKVAGEASGALLILGSAVWGWFSARQKTQAKNEATILKGYEAGTVSEDHPVLKKILSEPPPPEASVSKSLGALQQK